MLIRALALPFFGLAIATIDPSDPCAFKKVATDPGFIRTALKDSASPSSKEYLENQADAANYFSKTFWQSSPPSALEILQEMHKLSVGGESGTNAYEAREGMGMYSSDHVAKGKLRQDAKNGEPLIYDWGYRKGEEPILREVLQKQTENLVRVTDKTFRWVTQLEGIPQEALPSNKVNAIAGLGAYHEYPKMDFVKKYYLPRMESLVKSLREQLRTPPPSNRDLFLKTLADYYQVGINAHLFDRVNQSLLMNQVNRMLERAGIPTVFHGNLDLAALSLNSADFRRYFSIHVEK